MARKKSTDEYQGRPLEVSGGLQYQGRPIEVLSKKAAKLRDHEASKKTRRHRRGNR